MRVRETTLQGRIALWLEKPSTEGRRQRMPGSLGPRIGFAIAAPP